MKSVTVQNLPVNAFLDMPVFLDEHYILITPEVPVTQELKQRLTKWGYKSVSTDGSPVESPPLQDKNGGGGSVGAAPATAVLESNIKEQQHREAAVQFFVECSSFLQEVFDIYLERNIININTITGKRQVR